ncbi:hypothetical protein V6Z96_008578 [Aspergillus fumigatus]
MVIVDSKVSTDQILVSIKHPSIVTVSSQLGSVLSHRRCSRSPNLGHHHPSSHHNNTQIEKANKKTIMHHASFLRRTLARYIPIFASPHPPSCFNITYNR